ncbi:hypothetical protein BSKO_13055 [Bryopsis sp. KO-2023]|nr:hypothetical protein BSKO_13055 [Bryopsis sp. KO-2023]
MEIPESLDCPTCGAKQWGREKLKSHMSEEHEVMVRITYTWPANHITLMYNDDTQEMEKTKGDEFAAELSVPEGRLSFCFIVDGQQFRVAANHAVDENQNVVEVRRKGKKDVQEIHCTGYSFEGRVASERSQYSSGGASACTPIAMEAIDRMLAGLMTDPTPSMIDTVLRNGAKRYDHLKAICLSLGVDHLMPSEVYGTCEDISANMDYIGWSSGDRGMDDFEKIHDLAKWMQRTGQPVGATLTTMNMSLCIFLPGSGDGPVMFDSHSTDYGDGQPNGASLFYFKDMKQLQVFLTERFPQIDGLALTGLSQYELNVFSKKGMRSKWQKESEALFQHPTETPEIVPGPTSPNSAIKIEEGDLMATASPNSEAISVPLDETSPSLAASGRNANMVANSPMLGSDHQASHLTGGLLPRSSDGPLSPTTGRSAGPRDGNGLSPNYQADGVPPASPVNSGAPQSFFLSHSIPIMMDLNGIIERSCLLCEEIKKVAEEKQAGPLWEARCGILMVAMRGLKERLLMLSEVLGHPKQYMVEWHAFNEFLEMVDSHVVKFDGSKGVDPVNKMIVDWQNIKSLWKKMPPVEENMSKKPEEDNRRTAPGQSDPTGSEPTASHPSRPPSQNNYSGESTINPGPSLNQMNRLGNASEKQRSTVVDAGAATQDSDHGGVLPVQSWGEPSSSGRMRGETRSTPAPPRAVDGERSELDQERGAYDGGADGAREEGGWTQVHGKSTKKHCRDSSIYPAQGHTRNRFVPDDYSQEPDRHMEQSDRYMGQFDRLMEQSDRYMGQSDRVAEQSDTHTDSVPGGRSQGSIPPLEGGTYYIKGQNQDSQVLVTPVRRQPLDAKNFPEYSKCGEMVWKMVRRQRLLDPKAGLNDRDMSSWVLRCKLCSTELVSSVLLIVMEAPVHDIQCKSVLPAFGFSDIPPLAEIRHNRIICERCTKHLGIVASKVGKETIKCGVCSEQLNDGRICCVNERDANTSGDSYYFLYTECLEIFDPTSNPNSRRLP